MNLDTKAPASLPEGRRVYAIGDVHGCADRLRELHRIIAEHMRAHPVAEPVLIHLGDYVDRGPDSAGAIEELLRPWPAPAPLVIDLKGNHEALMLAALDGNAACVETWLANGAPASLESWGLSIIDTAATWAAGLPAAHLAKLRGLSLSHVEGGYMFVHAGVRPDVPLDRQSPEDLVWIREPFLSWRKPLDRVIVHGHTPRPRPELRPSRIGIDTGAVFGGRLTCLVLEADRLGFMQT